MVRLPPSVPYTSGFGTAAKLTDHFDRHGAEFGATTEAAYAAMADSFNGRPLSVHMRECTQRSRDILRFNETTQEFGARTDDGVILTYHKKTGIRRTMSWFQQRCQE